MADSSLTVVRTIPQKYYVGRCKSLGVLGGGARVEQDSEEHDPFGGSRTPGGQAVKGFGPGDRKLLERFHCGKTRMERSVLAEGTGKGVGGSSESGASCMEPCPWRS